MNAPIRIGAVPCPLQAMLEMLIVFGRESQSRLCIMIRQIILFERNNCIMGILFEIFGKR
jgi:hypothetical protein